MRNRAPNTFWLFEPLKIFLFILFAFLIFTLLSRQVSIYNAIQTCDTPHLAQDEEPLVVQAQLSTNEIASKHMRDTSVEDGWLPVWYVTLEGKWHVFGGPAPEEGQPETEIEYYDHCSVAINFFTGIALRTHATSNSRVH